MFVEQVSAVDNSIVIGSVALLTCIVFVIVAVVNSLGREGNFTNLNPEENRQNEQPEVITEQPIGSAPADCCCIPCYPDSTFYFMHCGNCGSGCGDCGAAGDCCCGCDCCGNCDCCAGCDACTGCDFCIGADACIGCDACFEACCSGACEFCTPELCFWC